MPKATLPTASLYYELHGAGHALVLIAGYSCDHTYWLPILDTLCQHFQVLLIDNRGCGQTTDSAQHLTIDLMADDVVALCAQLNLHQPHLVGQSMGGMIAQRIAIRYPQHISQIGLLTSTAKCRLPARFAFENILRMRKENIALDLIIDAVLPWLYSADFLNNPDHIRLFKETAINNPYPQSLNDQIRQLSALHEFDNSSELHQIQAPTLIAYGTEDIIVLPEEANFLADHIPNAELIALHCAHGIAQEIPGEVAKLIMDKFQH